MNQTSQTTQTALDPPRYTASAQALHWISAALMFFVVPCAWYMLSLAREDPARAEWHTIHKSVGVLILVLTVARLVWRGIKPPPPMAGHPNPLEKLLAEAAHGLLYVMLFVMPISGYLGSVANGRAVNLFGVLPLPTLIAPDKELAHVAHLFHEAGQWVVYLLVAMHILAALGHTLIRKDGTLERMLPKWLAK
ncbi:cytochrome b [Telmatospirillum siberiense]|uniref:Cytochrome B n=1 Tax=Telmatospirillum siberiense TaxID=382514 RepID=A0A2N3PLZ3_9PROT|nr:cytochrome b [Telmatospirillum siberiense]PKU21423.1 cytochrome B [Telmatospirillum siberiense]